MIIIMNDNNDKIDKIINNVLMYIFLSTFFLIK